MEKKRESKLIGLFPITKTWEIDLHSGYQPTMG